MPFDIDPQYVETPAEAKPDVFSLDGLIAWLEKQPAQTRYRYTDPENCLFGQFCAAHSRGYPVVLHGWKALVAFGHPQTFGAALARAKALRGRQP